MRGTEVLRLVWLNIIQNKFKSVMTSIGIIVGAATIVMVIAIGRGGQMDVAEQFSSLNAGAIDISYEMEGEEQSGGFSLLNFGNFAGGIQNMFDGRNGKDGQSAPDMGQMSRGGGRPDMSQMSGGGEVPDIGQMPGGGEMPDISPMSGDGERPDMSQMPGDGEVPDIGQMPEGGEKADMSQVADDEKGKEQEVTGEKIEDVAEKENESENSITDERMNQEKIIMTEEDVDDILTFVSGVCEATISYTARASVEGGNLTEAQTYTVAGVKEEYSEISKLSMAVGEFLTDSDNREKARVCVLGYSAAKELFGSVMDAYDSTIYIDDRAYVINGVLTSTGTVSAGITPDDAIFIPYETGKKYVTGDNISPTITVISEDVNAVDQIIESVEYVLNQNYQNAEFNFEDAGSKMEAAESSNEILTMLLAAMAVIVFIIGGIGIMNVLFVSVKERTNEIGILKSLGAPGSMILIEFLMESAAISLIGGVLGVGLSVVVTPIVEYYGVRVEANVLAWVAALGFAVLTGTVFGAYPAWKASRLVPVEALNAE